MMPLEGISAAYGEIAALRDVSLCRARRHYRGHCRPERRGKIDPVPG